MKRFDCTVGDRRGYRGECMQLARDGHYVEYETAMRYAQECARQAAAAERKKHRGIPVTASTVRDSRRVKDSQAMCERLARNFGPGWVVLDHENPAARNHAVQVEYRYFVGQYGYIASNATTGYNGFGHTACDAVRAMLRNEKAGVK